MATMAPCKAGDARCSRVSGTRPSRTTRGARARGSGHSNCEDMAAQYRQVPDRCRCRLRSRQVTPPSEQCQTCPDAPGDPDEPDQFRPMPFPRKGCIAHTRRPSARHLAARPIHRADWLEPARPHVARLAGDAGSMAARVRRCCASALLARTRNRRLRPVTRARTAGDASRRAGPLGARHARVCTAARAQRTDCRRRSLAWQAARHAAELLPQGCPSFRAHDQRRHRESTRTVPKARCALADR